MSEHVKNLGDLMAEMTEEYLTIDVTLLSRENKEFLLSLTKMYPVTETLPSMHRDGVN